ncbi:sodium-coupled neutral amino acid transporter 7-like isoform X1 [Dermacentor albipictus]|uniref:sodium-coupled neutral amino acid transporter 7-like isoform X1 n=1 Tax=Dermacentor albipictus TaxID=60249 RepID=UPI0031FDAECB
MSASQVVPEYDVKFITTNSLETQGERNVQDDSSTSSMSNGAKGKRESHGSSWVSAVFLIINAALGAGLLNFPHAFDQAGGIAVALSVQAVLLLFVVGALLVLAYCARRQECSTYQEVVLRVCGPRFWSCCSLAVALYCYGTCITFLVIVGDFSDRIFASLYGPSYCIHWFMHRDFVIVTASIVLILPMCFSRKIDFLKYPSIFGVLAALYLVLLIVVQYFVGNSKSSGTRSSPSSLEDVLTAVPVVCFGYQCHVSSVPIYSCLEDRRLSTFAKAVLSATLLTASLYTVAGVFGYLTFGQGVASDILELYDARQPLVLVGILAMALKIITTYPILIFCGRTAVDDLYGQLRSLDEDGKRNSELLRRITIVSIWFCTTVVLACLVPNISIVIRIIGSLAATFIFVFPGLCLLFVSIKLDGSYYFAKTKWKLATAVLCVALGMFVFGQVLTMSIMDAASGHGQAADVQLCTVPKMVRLYSYF